MWDQIWNLRKCKWLIFHASLSRGEDGASTADTKSNRCQGRWNMYGPPSGQSGDDISKHTLNECLHSVKKIDQWARFRKRHRNQNSATKINVFRKAGGESESRLEIWAAGCEGLKSNNYDVGMLFILGIGDTLLFFCISENITSKSWGFSFHGVTHDISVFSNLLDSIPALLLLFLHFWTIVFRKTSKSFECRPAARRLTLVFDPIP